MSEILSPTKVEEIRADLTKIALCQEYYAFAVGHRVASGAGSAFCCYIGDSTRGEIAYAEAHGKPVLYLDAARTSQEGKQDA